MAKVDSWSEIGYVSITAQGGTAVEFRCLTETIDIDIGEKSFDVMNTMCGGSVVKFTPQEPTELTFEAYPVEAGTDTGATGKGFFDLLHTADATQPISVPIDFLRNKYRVTMTWADAVLANAEAIIPTATTVSGLRIICSDGFFTSAKPSFTDGVLKWTVTYKVPAFDKSGSANVKVESTDGSADLTAPAAYTSSTKW